MCSLSAIAGKSMLLSPVDGIFPKPVFPEVSGARPVKPEKCICKKIPEEITMAKRPTCAHCGKDAIGFQSFGCRSACVCQDHAYGLLLALRPGEKYSSGEFCFERFGQAGS